MVPKDCIPGFSTIDEYLQRENKTWYYHYPKYVTTGWTILRCIAQALHLALVFAITLWLWVYTGGLYDILHYHHFVPEVVQSFA